jgi:hypothetical protein
MAASAVITADIVNSTKLSREDEKKLLQTISSVLKGNIFEFYRGDSFQAYIEKPAGALALVLQIRAAAIRLPQKNPLFRPDTKISIGIDKVQRPLKSLRTARGEAFILSGRVFDDLSSTEQRLAIVCNDQFPEIQLGLRVIASFADFLLRSLTAKQAAVIFELLQGHSQVEIAQRLKKTQATINKHVQSAGWPAFMKLLEDYQKLVSLL